MLQKLNPLDLSLLYTDDQKKLAVDLECELGELRERATIGGLLEVIRRYHQLGIYTADDDWCIQLFELEESANEEIPCLYENFGSDLIKLLYVTMEWIYDRLNDN
ncbi:hypothetical protein MKY95_23280 [Paenibacillus sp. FSL P4-0176]|uniref:hypothetical protein n=1 Tax=Paenibacillus sp. FSL P4-0176 TaxID=2921631 RepID=UPI0030CB6F59